MRNIYMFQPQHTQTFKDRKVFWLPYSCGTLWSYANQFDHIRENFELKYIFFKRDKPEDVMARIEDPKVCGFSCYVWNENYCLTMAKEIKAKWPDCHIVFGGEQVTDSFKDYDFIDSIIKYEGEENFVTLLEHILEGTPVPESFPKKRIQQLDIPSPYATGVFDPLLEEYPDASWNMIFETNRGCPFSCTFCNWGSLTQSKIKNFDLDRVREDIEWIIGKPIGYLMLADANFGAFRQRDLEVAKILREVSEKSELDAVNVQFAKNFNETIWEIAKELGPLFRGLTVSVQSMHDKTLDAIKRRNMDMSNMQKIMKDSKVHGITTYSELILGLPEETLETWKEGFIKLIEAGQNDSIDIWHAQLLENSELAHPSSREKYGLKTIKVKDYMPLHGYNYWEDIEETIEIVNETNTMSKEELIEAFMWAWMMINVHITGYSQNYSKNYEPGYRAFYDKLFHDIRTNKNNFLHEEHNKIERIISHYLETGDIIDNKYRGHIVLQVNAEFFYVNRDEVYSMLEELFDINDEVMICVQRNFLYDGDVNYPLEIDFENEKIIVDTKMENIEKFDFYALRRQQWLKNKIEIIKKDKLTL